MSTTTKSYDGAILVSKANIVGECICCAIEPCGQNS